MARRGDNIRKRKDGRWEGRYKKGRNIDGSIIYGSVYGKSYFEVKEKLSANPSHGQSLNKMTDSEVTLDNILSRWITSNQIRLKGGTINKYQNIIDAHIKPDLGKIRIKNITSAMINEYLLQKMENGKIDGSGGLSASYVRSIMLVINASLKFAAAEGLCCELKSPINKPKVTQKEIIVLSKNEQNKLEIALLSETNEINIGILISLYTGLRLGEICALSWNDIDLKNKIIHIRHTIARVKNNDPTNKLKTKLIVDTLKHIHLYVISRFRLCFFQYFQNCKIDQLQIMWYRTITLL